MRQLRDLGFCTATVVGSLALAFAQQDADFNNVPPAAWNAAAGRSMSQTNDKAETALHGVKLDAKSKAGFTPLDDSMVLLLRTLGSAEGTH